MAHLSLSMLGMLQVRLDGKPVTSFEYNKVKALLAYLAVESGEPHTREGLAALLWPDLPDAAARRNLTQALSSLRHTLADDSTTGPFLSITRETVRFNSGSDPELDLTTFSQRLAVRYHLGPLDLAETVGYVRHHVRAAGYTTGPLFTDDAIARIYEYTKGLPRRINQVCTTALMAGLIDQKQLLDETTIGKAIAELDHD